MTTVINKNQAKAELSTALNELWDDVEIETFDVKIVDGRTQKTVFEQSGVEFPVGWGYNDVTVVTSKYFRGHVGDVDREYQLKQLVTRVVKLITLEGINAGYFPTVAKAIRFAINLASAMMFRRGCFNSPVLFNFGWRDNPQASACFLLEVEDTIESLCMDHQGNEARLFRGGSGAGVNVGNVRSSYEKLSKGGYSSGPIGFMKGWDNHAGALKSGGVCLASRQKILTSKGIFTVKELAEWGKVFMAVSYTPGPGIDGQPTTGKFELKKATAAYSGLKKVVRLVTSRGDFETSFDHPIRLRAGSYSKAENINSETEVHEALVSLKSDQVNFIQSKTCGEDISTAIKNITGNGGDISYSCSTPETTSLEVLRVIDVGIEEVFDIEVECETEDDKSPNSGHNFIIWPDRKTADTPLDGGITVSGLVVSNTRRAAKMISMTDTHPDILEQRDGSPGFLRVKPLEERKAKVITAANDPKIKETLIANGLTFLKNFKFDTGFDGEVLNNLQHQNANYSVWASDAFMVNLIESYKPGAEKKLIVEYPDKTVEVILAEEADDAEWAAEHEKCTMVPVGFWFTREVKTGEVVHTYDIQEFFGELCSATWECGDPGLQFDGNINRLHSLLDTSRVTRSNPCIAAGMYVDTDEGMIKIEEIYRRYKAGEKLPNAFCWDTKNNKMAIAKIKKSWLTEENAEVLRISTTAGTAPSVTSNHGVLTNLEDGAASESSTLEFVVAGDLSMKSTLVSRFTGIHVTGVSVLKGRADVYDIEVEGYHNFGITDDPSKPAIIVHNCSEYLSLSKDADPETTVITDPSIPLTEQEGVVIRDKGSSCNLASLNLLKYVSAVEGGLGKRSEFLFDMKLFKSDIDSFVTAMDIICGFASYPTESIGRMSKRYREIGLGYTNLGAMLMYMGVPYDSEEGTTLCGAVTALLNAYSKKTSNAVAKIKGPFEGQSYNQNSMANVYRKFSSNCEGMIDNLEDSVPGSVMSVAESILREASSVYESLDKKTFSSFRNSKTTLLAPTGCLVPGTMVPLSCLGDIKGDEWQDINLSIASLGKNRKSNKFFVNKKSRTVEVITKNGYNLEGTLKHQIKVVDTNGDFVWRRMDEVQSNHTVPIKFDTMVGRPQVIKLLVGTGLEHFNMDKDVVLPKILTPELAELIGYFVGDGNSRRKSIRMCVVNTDRDVSGRLMFLIKKLFNKDAHIEENEGYHSVCIASTEVSEFFRINGFLKENPYKGHVGKGKVPSIPVKILESNSRPIYFAFLNGLFEADGSTYNDRISLSTVNIEFHRQVKSMMLTLGVVTNSSSHINGFGRNIQYKLSVKNFFFLKKFLAEFSFMGSRKTKRIEHMKDRDNPTSRYDVIPFTKDIAQEVLDKATGAVRKKLFNQRRRGGITRPLAIELVKENEELFSKTKFKELLESSCFFDRVVLAEKRNTKLTYDISVPSNNTYVANGFISHNTISFMMGADTTGIEAELGLMKTKSLVGGGYLTQPSQTLEASLSNLGYDSETVKKATGFVNENIGKDSDSVVPRNTIHGCPDIKEEHWKIFQTSFDPIQPLSHKAHINMMAAAQKSLDGAISKTVNIPESFTPDDIKDCYIYAYNMGVKCVAVYRDNCKDQPVKTKKVESVVEEGGSDKKLISTGGMARTRQACIHSVRINGVSFHITFGFFDDGSIGEIFINMNKSGSMLYGLLNCFAIAISLGIQNARDPKSLLENFNRSFINFPFEPAGMTDDKAVRTCKSIVDYIVRKIQEYQERGTIMNEDLKVKVSPNSVEGVDLSPFVKNSGSGGTGAREASFDDSPNYVSKEGVVTKASDLTGDCCILCGGLLEQAGSCKRCIQCGHSQSCG